MTYEALCRQIIFDFGFGPKTSAGYGEALLPDLYIKKPFKEEGKL